MEVASSSAVPTGFEEAWSSIASNFRQRMREGGHVGGALWLVSEGEVLEKEHYGYANLQSGRKIDDETIYHWASITKTFTGIAIMQLRDRGLLSLSDPVVEYLPSLREVHNPYGPTEDITIRMLLSHTAGFRSPTWPFAGDKEWQPHEPTRWSQLVAMMPYTKVHFEPGTEFRYSNPGYIFLGQIIEQLTGSEYETYVEKNIFAPLRMDRSYFDITPQHLLPCRSNNYTVTAEGDTVANGLDFNTGITVANGGLNAPAGDMLNYASFLTGSCEWEACKGVLSRSSLREMWEPAVPQVKTDTVSVAGEKQEWAGFMGLSFFVIRRGDAKVIYHTGSQKSFSSLLIVDPKAEVAAVTAFNSEGDPKPNAFAFTRTMQKRLFTKIFPFFR
jgi:CubicO group peptidase (beta-lactamase class C family)